MSVFYFVFRAHRRRIPITTRPDLLSALACRSSHPTHPLSRAGSAEDSAGPHDVCRSYPRKEQTSLGFKVQLLKQTWPIPRYCKGKPLKMGKKRLKPRLSFSSLGNNIDTPFEISTRKKHLVNISLSGKKSIEVLEKKKHFSFAVAALL
jgi:hypothetical protein